MIEVAHLSKRYGDLAAVSDVSFTAPPGQILGFLGPNGAGKTTTMRMLTGFLPASAGTIEIGGFDVLRQSLQVRAHIGYLPESVPLYREHRVQEMLLFQARLHSLPRAEARRRVAAVLERVGMGERARSLIGKLSKGQRQRVGLAVALLPDPQVLILDEPTSGLDPLQRIEVRSLIRELARERTVLLSSHILPEIEAVCPRVIVMHRGRIAADGSQAELVSQLGGETYVRVEARVPLAGMDGRGQLAALPGVHGVDEGEGAEGFRRFDVRGEGELCAAVGELAQARGWTLRELSWQRPTLEKLFARIALELEPARPAPAGAAPGAGPGRERGV